jgi:hypothetical protein
MARVGLVYQGRWASAPARTNPAAVEAVIARHPELAHLFKDGQTSSRRHLTRAVRW